MSLSLLQAHHRSDCWVDRLVNPHYKINDNVGNGNNNLVLTNVNIDDDTKLTNNLRTKRMIELGVGRAGGYSGYDDYELDELGVISGSSIGGGGGYGSSSIPGMFNSTGAAAEGK